MSSPKSARLVPQPEGAQPEEVTHISSFAVIGKGSAPLLVRRARPEHMAGSWCLPGTVILYGEDPEAAVRRVVKEQLGATAVGVKLIDVQSYGDKHWDLCFVYHVEAPRLGKLSGDFDKAESFELSKLPPELREGHREVLDTARSRKVI